MSTVDVMIVTTQNAPADVEKMILGNKSDLEKSRVVSRERGQQVMYMYNISNNTCLSPSLPPSFPPSLSLPPSILSSLHPLLVFLISLTLISFSLLRNIK